MRRTTIIALCAVAFLALSASKCENEEVAQGIQAAQEQAEKSPIPWVQLVSIVTGPIAAYFVGRRPAKAVYNALTYPNRDYTPDERVEITNIVVEEMTKRGLLPPKV